MKSADGTRDAYVSPADESVVVDGEHGPTWDEVRKPSLVFSPDNTHIAYVARRGRSWFAVVDHKPQGPGLDDIGINCDNWVDTNTPERWAYMPFFSWNSRHIAYVGTEGVRPNRKYCTVFGQWRSPFAEQAGGHLTFSPDSTRTAYTRWEEGADVLFVDGKVHGKYNDTFHFAFSPDSNHVAVLAGRYLFVDGLKHDVGGLSLGGFSSDSQYVLFTDTTEPGAPLRPRQLQIDGAPTPEPADPSAKVVVACPRGHRSTAAYTSLVKGYEFNAERKQGTCPKPGCGLPFFLNPLGGPRANLIACGQWKE